jgi:hypothetical protein
MECVSTTIGNPFRELIMKNLLGAVGAIVLLHIGGQAGAQDATFGDLKAKGAAVLSAEEVKDLLTDAVVRYENAQFITQLKMYADSKLVGSTKRRIGSAGGASLTGDWKVTDEGRWCGSVNSNVGVGADWCRTVLKVGNSYYYVDGAGTNPARPAYEMKISK